MDLIDTYKTIERPSEEILFKEKNSKFFASAFPVTSDEDIKMHLADLRKRHFGAGHFCYAWQMGTDQYTFRANDDGEPSNTAGMPILGQIKSFGLTNVLVVVVRFFGGTKLGVGGLISAYKTSAQLALENASIIERKIEIVFVIEFEYKNMNKVMRAIKENDLSIKGQKMQLSCMIEIMVRKSDAEKVRTLFTNMFEIKVSDAHL